MTRVFRHKNLGVYVADARGEPHHMPHAHIKERGSHICSINLFTLEPLQQNTQIPAGLLPELKAHQDEMLEKWNELNS
jgi:hypothetical protein